MQHPDAHDTAAEEAPCGPRGFDLRFDTSLKSHHAFQPHQAHGMRVSCAWQLVTRHASSSGLCTWCLISGQQPQRPGQEQTHIIVVILVGVVCHCLPGVCPRQPLDARGGRRHWGRREAVLWGKQRQRAVSVAVEVLRVGRQPCERGVVQGALQPSCHRVRHLEEKLFLFIPWRRSQLL